MEGEEFLEIAGLEIAMAGEGGAKSGARERRAEFWAGGGV